MTFIKKHKKLFITLSIILTLILVVIILLFTLFALKTVTFNFKTETERFVSEESKQEILDSVEIPYGRSVLFTGKRKLINDLEKKNPYLKIVNIETVFPNSYVIHCAEREEAISFINKNNLIICDEDLKVLRVVDKNTIFDSTSLNPIRVVTDFGFEKDFSEGDFLSPNDFLDNPRLYNLSKNIFKALEMNSRDIASIKATFKSVDFLLEQRDIYTAEYKIALNFKNQNGMDVKIYDAEHRLEEKFQKYLAAFPRINPSKYENHEIIVYETYEEENKEGIVRVILK